MYRRHCFYTIKYSILYVAIISSMKAYGSKWAASKARAGGVRIVGKTDLTAFLLRTQCAAEG